MKKVVLLIAILASNLSNAQTAKVDYDAFEKLVSEVKSHRQARLITLDMFQKMSTEKNVVILDTRSDAMYKAKHVKGAIHLNFSDFTQNNLAKLIPDKNTKILIYCNNNFDNDDLFFPTKSYVPPTKKEKGYTLALNIPTYINLYGYGYKNVYELSELISVMNPKIQFEGTTINGTKSTK
jgi:hypothetical protein